MSEPRGHYHAGRQVLKFLACPHCQTTIGCLAFVDGVWWLKVGSFTFAEFHGLHNCGEMIRWTQDGYSRMTER